MSAKPLFKVCGMKDRENITALLALNPDFIGFIFYPKSKRYIGNKNLGSFVSAIDTVSKVGVFVNESSSEITNLYNEYKLDFVQLHGNESPEFCTELQTQGIRIVKAFQVNEQFDFSVCDTYEAVCDYFLFDTKSESYGGSGKQFNWDLLKNYTNKKHYFLSGGISLADAESIAKLDDDRIAAIDINSKFENADGLKNIADINEFKNQLIQAG